MIGHGFALAVLESSVDNAPIVSRVGHLPPLSFIGSAATSPPFLLPGCVGRHRAAGSAEGPLSFDSMDEASSSVAMSAREMPSAAIAAPMTASRRSMVR